MWIKTTEYLDLKANLESKEKLLKAQSEKISAIEKLVKALEEKVMAKENYISVLIIKHDNELTDARAEAMLWKKRFTEEVDKNTVVVTVKELD